MHLSCSGIINANLLTLCKQNTLFPFKLIVFKGPKLRFSLCADISCQTYPEDSIYTYIHIQNEASVFLRVFQHSGSDLRSLLSLRQDSMQINVLVGQAFKDCCHFSCGFASLHSYQTRLHMTQLSTVQPSPSFSLLSAPKSPLSLSLLLSLIVHSEDILFSRINTGLAFKIFIY